MNWRRINVIQKRPDYFFRVPPSHNILEQQLKLLALHSRKGFKTYKLTVVCKDAQDVAEKSSDVRNKSAAAVVVQPLERCCARLRPVGGYEGRWG